MRHITEPHLSTPEDAQAYESLLAALRKDLQLDAATDLLANTILPAIMPGTSLQYLLDTAGEAPFLQLLVAAKWQVCFGVISSTGTEITGANVGSVVHGGTGSYTVTFATALASATPIVVATPVSTGALAIEVSSLSSTGFHASTFTSNTAANTDTQWAFVAIG